MVYTVTFNPSLDYIISVEDFAIGRTNRTGTEQLLVGGKGINVSIVLNNLGVQNTALGFTAGFTGEEIERSIKAFGFESDFIRVRDGLSRINVKLKNYDGTEINGKGPDISGAEATQLIEKLKKLGLGMCLCLRAVSLRVCRMIFTAPFLKDFRGKTSFLLLMPQRICS